MLEAVDQEHLSAALGAEPGWGLDPLQFGRRPPPVGSKPGGPCLRCGAGPDCRPERRALFEPGSRA